MNRQLFEYHPTYGYRFIPGLRVRIPHESGGYLVRVNSDGFRSDYEFDASPPPSGRSRVLLFGDSYTAGEGVSNAQRYGDQLERLLPDVQIYNYGLPGSGTDQQYLIYRDVASRIPHDAILIGVLVENIRRVVARYRLVELHGGEKVYLPKPYFELVGGRLELRNVPVPKRPVPVAELPRDEHAFADVGGDHQWLRQAIGKLGEPVKQAAQRLSGYQPLPEYDSANHPAWLLLRAIMSAWVAESRVPILIVPVPLYHYVEEVSSPASYRARFAELRADTGVAIHDPLPDLLSKPYAQRRTYRFATDIHPTAEGHAALATSLRPALQQLLAQCVR